ncbi:hypothetical protein N7526_002023 [Penicillium atrosanguineum]|nr:hypothetical protein N7526_002023 [Penicillium atrosanguineum]
MNSLLPDSAAPNRVLSPSSSERRSLFFTLNSSPDATDVPMLTKLCFKFFFDCVIRKMKMGFEPGGESFEISPTQSTRMRKSYVFLLAASIKLISTATQTFLFHLFHGRIVGCLASPKRRLLFIDAMAPNP